MALFNLREFRPFLGTLHARSMNVEQPDQTWYNGLMKADSAEKAFAALVDTIKALRDPDTGCPWDIKQTHSSLKQYLIEEAYELLEAIDSEPDTIKEELGDVLLQIMLHSQIAADDGRFSIADVIHSINEKMIERHPHVFGNETRESAEAVAESWEQRKQAKSRGLLDGLPKVLPALQKAHLIGARTGRVGFDWDSPDTAAEKVKEEVDEYLDAVRQGKPEAKIEEELGDLLFSIAQLSRKQALNSEEVLQRANSKFIARFQFMEKQAARPLAELSDDVLQELWQQAKDSLT